MNIDYYKNFVTIIETGSISAASRHLLVAQPALSGQIKALEQELGVTLLIRTTRSLRLTDAGQLFYMKAKKICELDNDIRNGIDENKNGLRGVLCLGISPCFPDYLISDLCTKFYMQNPNIHFEMYELVSDEIVDKLKEKTIEVGIIRGPSLPLPPMLSSVVTFPERLMAVFHHDNPWLDSDAQEIHISKLKDVPISISRCFQKMFFDACTHYGFSPNYANVCTLCGTAMMLGKNGVNVSIISTDSESKIEREGICCRPLIGEYLSTQRSIVVLNDHSLSAVAQHFLIHCKKAKKTQTD